MKIADKIQTHEQLDGLYRKPSELVVGKTRTSIDEASARFIGLCPFVILSTADANGGIDASPRGGPPGFLQVLNNRHLAIPDLNGNNRIDSLRNIVDNPQAGLLLMVPGVEETIRINGPATLTTDAAILGGFTQELRSPKLAVVIETQELFSHCAKAYRRSNLWNPSEWEAMSGAPDLADIYTCQFPGIDAAAMRVDLEKSYANDLTQD